MKVVINKCFGGFGLSYKAIMRFSDYDGIESVEEEHKVWS